MVALIVLYCIGMLVSLIIVLCGELDNKAGKIFVWPLWLLICIIKDWKEILHKKKEKVGIEVVDKHGKRQ